MLCKYLIHILNILKKMKDPPTTFEDSLIFLFGLFFSYLTIPPTLSKELPGGQHMVPGLSDCNTDSSGVGQCWTSLQSTSLK